MPASDSIRGEAKQSASSPSASSTTARNSTRAAESLLTSAQNIHATCTDSDHDRRSKSVTSNTHNSPAGLSEGFHNVRPSNDGYSDRAAYFGPGRSGHSRYPMVDSYRPDYSDHQIRTTTAQQSHYRQDTRATRDNSRPDTVTRWDNPEDVSVLEPPIKDWRSQSSDMRVSKPNLPTTYRIYIRKEDVRIGAKPVYHRFPISGRPASGSKFSSCGPHPVLVDSKTLRSEFAFVGSYTSPEPLKENSDVVSSRKPGQLTQQAAMIEKRIKEEEEEMLREQKQKALQAEKHQKELLQNQEEQRVLLERQQKEVETKKRHDLHLRDLTTIRPNLNDPHCPKEDYFRDGPRREQGSYAYSRWYRMDLLDEARFRGLQLDRADSRSLEDALKFNDEAFNKNFRLVRNRCANVSQLRNDARRAGLSIDGCKTYCYTELLEEIAEKLALQAEHAEAERRRRDAAKQAEAERARRDAAQQAEAEEAKRVAAKLKEAAASELKPRQDKQLGPSKVMKRRVDPLSPDSGYSTGQSKPSPPTFKSASTSGHESVSNQSQDTTSKGTKRQRAAQIDEEQEKPVKKTKTSSEEQTPPRVIKIPRSSLIQTRGKRPVIEDDSDIDVEMIDAPKSTTAAPIKRGVATAKAKSKKATGSSLQKSSTGTARTKTVRPVGVAVKVTRKAKEIESSDDENYDSLFEDVDMEDSTEDDMDDFIEDDMDHKPKRKSRVGEMAASGLIRGMK